jgi:tetratricopeptide (TPR) repeat protein
MIHNDLGEADLARTTLERDLAAARDAAELQTTVPHLAELARAYVALGRDADAAGMIQELLDWVDRFTHAQSDCTIPLLVACRWFAAQTALDRDAVQASVERLRSADQRLGTVETRAALAEGTGLFRLASDAPLQAAEQFQRAATGWESLGRPHDQARALDALGDALRRAGHDAAAGAAFDRARAIHDALASQLADPALRASFLNVRRT